MIRPDCGPNATVSGYLGDHPARWRAHLDHILPKPSEVQNKEHYAAMPHSEIGEFTATLRGKKGVTPMALEFVILAAARAGEVVTGAM
jgi:hypothetical protein